MSKTYFKARKVNSADPAGLSCVPQWIMHVSLAEWTAIRRLDRMLAKARSGEMDVFRAYQEWQKVRES